MSGRLETRVLLRAQARRLPRASLEGAIDQKLLAIRTLAAEFEESECSEVRPIDRGRVQMIYVPAVRDGASQLTAFLRGRIWRAITWSDPGDLVALLTYVKEGLFGEPDADEDG